MRHCMGALAAMSITVPAAAGFIEVTPSTEEAVARGLVYEIQGVPQQQGLDGFGCGFSDLDADGDPDVILLGAANGQVGIFENDGTGNFTDRSLTTGIPLLTSASGFAAGDVDGDGLPDLYVTQAGAANLLLVNNGGFSFTNVASTAGVADVGAGTGASFGDFDGDGRLDLYVCNYNGALPGTEFINNLLYRNNGDGTFTDVAPGLGVDDHGYGFQSVWFDADQDGDLDLYLSNDRGHLPPLFRANRLWLNAGGALVDVSVPSGAGVALFSMGVACGDFSNNGWADLYCTNIAGYEEGFNPLLLNTGSSPVTFIEASAVAGVDNWTSSWGSIFYDFDNNGYQDLYVNNMFVANSLYLTDGSFPCEDLAAQAAVQGNDGVSYGSAVADVDDDGDLDLLVNNLSHNVELFINHEGQSRSWVKLRMIGLGENPNAVGGRVLGRVGGEPKLREILAGGNGYLGQNELVMHIGLGAAGQLDELDAHWPGGAVQRAFTDLPANATWTLYPPSALGDADGNGANTLDDYLAFLACAAGGFQPGCEMMDFDGNSVLDDADLTAFVAAYDDPLHDCDDNGQVDLLDMYFDPSADQDGTGIPDACEAGGDLDGDGQVGAVDFLILLGAWGPCDGACPADLDGDGAVATPDFLLLLANWG